MAHQTNNHENSPAPHDDEDLNEESLEAYIRRTYATQSNFDELLQLHASEGVDSTGFQEALADLAYDALDENEQFTRNIRRLKVRGLSAEEDSAIRAEQKALFERYKLAIVHEAGIPEDGALDAMEGARAKVSHLLTETLQNNENAEIDDVLKALGIIVVDKDGNDRFHYPEDLFPARTNEKWKTYISAVMLHVKADKELKAKRGSKAEVEYADGVRTVAHTAVTTDIDAILGLSQLDDHQWDFKKSRALIAKMRDVKFPTVETRESQLTATAIADGLIGVHALKSLIKKK